MKFFHASAENSATVAFLNVERRGIADVFVILRGEPGFVAGAIKDIARPRIRRADGGHANTNGAPASKYSLCARERVFHRRGDNDAVPESDLMRAIPLRIVEQFFRLGIFQQPRLLAVFMPAAFGGLYW